ncbi:blue (type 1) copper domain-containing protein [Haloterrigena salina JCM 13891]|uniref:Blue (Type 1) copper domain-containing protein n=1 Tax=Haloterrigena salina JCM 13891 TaxID=1227488 RepID=M0CFA3_9EURY|nr:blue (type 1) copper domain-containing protein [Haloterrigena salina JCM 13891]
MIRAAGLATATAALAGCIDESSVDGPDDAADADADSQSSDEQGSGSEPDETDDESQENGDEATDDAEAAPFDIELRGEHDGWRVLEPSGIEDDVNPTLPLEAGRTYRLGWTEGDGLGHNIEIRDAHGDVINGLSTPVTQEPDEDQWLEFVATEEMATYVCAPHESTMRGEIAVETPVDRGSDSSDDEESAEGQEVRIDPGTRIDFSAQTIEWKGIAPASIEDLSNPTLVLEAGETYELGWTEGDGTVHNIEIRNADDEVVDDLSTELTSEEQPADQFLAFEASDEMAAYACEPHRNTMHGEIRIEGSTSE